MQTLLSLQSVHENGEPSQARRSHGVLQNEQNFVVTEKRGAEQLQARASKRKIERSITKLRWIHDCPCNPVISGDECQKATGMQTECK